MRKKVTFCNQISEIEAVWFPIWSQKLAFCCKYPAIERFVGNAYYKLTFHWLFIIVSIWSIKPINPLLRWRRLPQATLSSGGWKLRPPRDEAFSEGAGRWNQSTTPRRGEPIQSIESFESFEPIQSIESFESFDSIFRFNIFVSSPPVTIE